MKTLLSLISFLFLTQIALSQTTDYGRNEIAWPDLGFPGGAGLHTALTDGITDISDDQNSRFQQYTSIADSATVQLDHNFGVAFDQISVLLYDGTGTNLTRIVSGGSPDLDDFTISATTGSEKTSIDIDVPASGGPHTFAAIVIHGSGVEFIDQLLDVDTSTTAPQVGQSLIWDGTNWIPGGGGGGGGSITWNPVSGLEPTSEEVEGDLVYIFADGGSEQLSVNIKVPETYTAGNQINMRIGSFSPSTSNSFLMSTTSCLVRRDLDAIDSTTNCHNSTNGALTNTVANQYRSTLMQLTDGSGQLNSISVSAGDIIRVDLLRGTDTDTADVRVIPSTTEVSF